MHTTGPWTASGPDPFGDYNISPPHERAVVAAVVSNVRPPAEVAANARLVAEAPNLAAVLSEIEGMPCSMVNDSESLRHTIKTIQQMARNALTKARGY